MSYRSGYGGGYPSKKPLKAGTTSKGYSMNAVPPPSSLNDSRGRGGRSNSSFNQPPNQQQSGIPPGGLSKQGYSTMDAIAQFANSAQYSLGKRKSKTEDE